MKKCPFCAEEIQEQAVRCKHCSSDLIDHQDDGKKVKASKHKDYKKFTLVSLILPIVGFILGIVYLTKNRRLDKKLGEHLLAVSIGFAVLWGAGWGFFVSSYQQEQAQELQEAIDANQRALEEAFGGTLYDLGL